MRKTCVTGSWLRAAMTSSEPESPRPVEAQPEEPAPRLIASGHLHPGMLFLRFLDGIRQSVLPVAIGLVSGQLWLLVLAGVYFVLSLVYALARYLTFEYRLTEEELVTTEGILHRQERRIPVNRIQDLSFESTLVRRIFGLVVVSVETASSQGSEATLDSLSRRHAEHLRESLYQTRALRGLGDPEASAAAPAETVLLRTDPAELFLLGLTNNRIGVIIAALFGGYELVAELGLEQHVGGFLSGWLSGVSNMLAVVLVLLLLFVALLGGWVVSVAASFLMFWRFTLSVRSDIFQRRYGLITKRAASLPRRKVQRVLVEQTWMRRLFGLAVLRADSAGSGMDPMEEARGGRDVVVPIAERSRAEALVPWLLPGLSSLQLAWNRVSPRVVLRIFLKGVLAAIVLSAVSAATLGWGALVALVLLPISWAVGVLSYHNLGYAEEGDHLGLRWGIIGRYRALVPLRKVQGVVVRASPLDRCLRLSALTVYVAGGSPTTLRHLPRDEARMLQDRLTRHAAGSRFVW